MLIVLGVLMVTTLLVSATFIAVSGDAHTSQHDLDGKRAYAAAQAALNTYLYQLNQNTNYWETCSNDYQSITAVPGSTTGEQYSYQPVLANGSSSCTSDFITSLIDKQTSTLRMEFTGYSGNPQVQRTIVASFGKRSPFDFLWYTIYEAIDPGLGSSYSGCGVFLRTGNRPSQCNINRVSGDVINGPMYTQDQYLVDGSPTFGRSLSDNIESSAPGTSPADICELNTGNSIQNNNCGSANIKGKAIPSAETISPPSSDSQLLVDATKYGQVFTGITWITLSGSTATVKNCPSSCTTTSVNISQYPIIYVSNGSGCTPYSYSPYNVTYYQSGCYGDVYVQGNYSSPLTIASANNVIIDGSVTTSEDGSGNPTGPATLGLAANEYIRIMHGQTYGYGGQCSGDVQGQVLNNPKIDAGMLAIQHSFIVDNFNCGEALGNLNVNGAIAQYYRGPVGTFGQSQTGYLKNYNYDNRLAVLLPPYLFDIASWDWQLTRETLCTPGSSGSGGCNAPG